MNRGLSTVARANPSMPAAVIELSGGIRLMGRPKPDVAIEHIETARRLSRASP